MSKKFIFILIIIVVIIGMGCWVYQLKKETGKLTGPEKVTLDSKNCTYIIEGKNITLKDGYSEKEIAPDSASKVITQYFGNEVSGDFNGDGLSDIAFILTQDPGGSGTFYYIVVALGDANGCKGTNAIFLGDRIAPQTTEIQDGKIVVNYADRKIDEAMVTPPSIGITKQFALEGTTLKEITSEETKKEQACLLSGGTIKTSLCCASISGFPNSCGVGGCSCSPAGSRQMKVCDCGADRCFDGEKCWPIETSPQAPSIDSIFPNSGSIGTMIEVRGKNFSGFEGDLDAWIENTKGVKGIVYGETGSNGSLIRFTLKSSFCQIDTSYSGLPCSGFLNITPGIYKIYVAPWGQKSNEVTFTVTFS